ncbi:hypothetical protein ABW19_dt0207252 [Dactylella cylindrospora]|nr:hypothetical protein ABW19_dt0207252 [Dactylella cylindrospora]
MSDKARFYLEQGIPELQELERKKIFTKEEIQSISRKRSHHEHRISASRCKPADFLSYATYEMNLESLRRKRMKRLNVRMKGASNHLGARRIFFIFQRATRKFHGDVQLWRTYVEFCRSEKSYGLLRKVMDSLLRLHPTKEELWVYAAKIAMEDNGNMTEARGYLQKGLRFCRRSRVLWLEYAKYECIFIGKVADRSQMIPVGEEGDPNGLDEVLDDMEEDSSVTLEGDEIQLPTISEAELNGVEEQEDIKMRQQVTGQPNDRVLEGAIPIIVFDEAVSVIPNDPSLAVSFFKLFEDFTSLQCQKRLLAHVDVHLMTTCPTNASALLCHVKEVLVGIEVTDPTFPAALKVAFKRFGEARAKADDKKVLYDGFSGLLRDILAKGKNAEGGLDESLEKAVKLFLGRVVSWASDDGVILGSANRAEGTAS